MIFVNIVELSSYLELLLGTTAAGEEEELEDKPLGFLILQGTTEAGMAAAAAAAALWC